MGDQGAKKTYMNIFARSKFYIQKYKKWPGKKKKINITLLCNFHRSGKSAVYTLWGVAKKNFFLPKKLCHPINIFNY